MTSLLITGGAGFIGANFTRRWRGRRPADTIVVLDALTYAGRRSNLEAAPDIVFVHGDIRDQDLVERLLSEHRIDTIVHFAAESHVDRSIHGPDAFIETNVVGTHALLKAARKAWLDTGSGRPHRFHHVSTDEVYGSLGPDDPAFCETTPYAPNSPYSASKAGSDHLVRAYNQTFGLETTISNCSNNFGPYQHPEKLIPLFLINALHGRALPVYGDGQNVRDWLDVADHCGAIELILAKGRPGDTYNVGGGSELANLAVVERLCEAVDRAIAADPALCSRFPDAPAAKGGGSARLVTFVADRLGHDRRYAIDDAKIRGELGYVPAGNFATSLTATLAWYLENEAWWREATTGDYRTWIETNYKRA
ncbi:MAG TPA: dTDP-glucose 4,6-dehydratase [Caulobacteraceae bacterium]|nr:dTDP-glucose 4,6-dehydratase [Caulobacteraceae bacterium]